MTANEETDFCKQISKIEKLKIFLREKDAKYNNFSPKVLEDFIAIKNILGNVNTSINFLSCLQAKLFLEKQFTISLPEITEKTVNSPRLKIDFIFPDKKRLIADVKTTSPVYNNDFGAKQKEEIQKILNKLRSENAVYKYLFVINAETLKILHSQYTNELAGISVQLLPL